MKRFLWLARAASLLVSLALIAALVHYVGVGAILAALAHTNWLVFAAALAVQMLIYALWALKLQMSLRRLGYAARMRDLLKTIFITLFSSNVIPIPAVTSSMTKTYLLHSFCGLPVSKGFAASVIDEMADFTSYLLYAVLALLALFFVFHIPLGALALLILITLALASFPAFVVLVIVNKRRAVRLGRWFFHLFCRIKAIRKYSERYEFRVEKQVSVFRRAINSIKDRNTLAKIFAIAMLNRLLGIVRVALVFYSLGAAVPLFSIGIVHSLDVLTNYVPLLPGGEGLNEIASTALYAFAGVSAVTAASAALLTRLIYFWLSTAIGFAAFEIFVAKRWGMRKALRRRAKHV